MSSFPEKLADRFRRFHHRHFLPKAEEYEELATYGQSARGDGHLLQRQPRRPGNDLQRHAGRAVRRAQRRQPRAALRDGRQVPRRQLGHRVRRAQPAHQAPHRHGPLRLRRRQSRPRPERRHSDRSAVHLALDVDARRRAPAGARRASDRRRTASSCRRWRRKASRPPSPTCARSRSSPMRRTRAGCRCTAPTSTSPPARCRCSITRATSSSRCSGAVSMRHGSV